MATGTATTVTSTQPQQQHSQYSNATVSSISLSNGTVSNLGNYYTTNSNAVWSVYSNYMKPKSFKLR